MSWTFKGRMLLELETDCVHMGGIVLLFWLTGGRECPTLIFAMY
jgi:hypothetical protein